MRRRSTVRKWIFKNLLIFVLPLLFAIGFMLFYMVAQLTNNTIILTGQTAALYTSQFDYDLTSMERLLVTIYNNNINISNMQVSSNQNLVNESKIAVSLAIKNKILIHNRTDGMFVAIDKADEWIFIPVSNENSNVYISDQISNLIEENIKEMKLNTWFIADINDVPYLFQISKQGNAYCGAWRNLNSLAKELEAYYMEQDAIVIIKSADGRYILDDENNTRRLLINNYTEGSNYTKGSSIFEWYIGNCQEASISGFEFYVFIPISNVLQKIMWLEAAIVFLVILIIVFIIVFLNQMQDRVVKPSIKICKAMEQIETQDLLQLSNNCFVEFNTIADGFNQMKTQIHGLRIKTYEQKMHENKIHMHYLAAQIQPHFFLNTLHLIYSFATIKRYDLIQRMTLSLVNYFRYVFRNSSKLVVLREELEHISNFMSIQEVRAPRSFVYVKEVEEDLLDIKILPFLLQTFIENSIKYGFTKDKTNTILLTIHKLESDEGDMVKIIIKDSGNGFSEEELTKLNEKYPEDNEGIYKIGIQNTRQRLYLLYGENSNIKLSNDNGALVEIIFPIRYDEDSG